MEYDSWYQTINLVPGLWMGLDCGGRRNQPKRHVMGWWVYNCLVTSFFHENRTSSFTKTSNSYLTNLCYTFARAILLLTSTKLTFPPHTESHTSHNLNMMTTSSTRALLAGLLLLLGSTTAAPTSESSEVSDITASFLNNDDLPGGCTSTSLHDFHWRITNLRYTFDLTYTTPSHRINNAEVSFNLTSNALPELNVYCQAYSQDYMDPFYGQRVYDCEAPVNLTSGAALDETKGGKAKTQFRYWQWNQSVEVKQTWECDDLEGVGNMAIFTGNGTSAAQTPNCTHEEHSMPPGQPWKNGDIYYWSYQHCTLPEFSFVPTELQVFA